MRNLLLLTAFLVAGGTALATRLPASLSSRPVVKRVFATIAVSQVLAHQLSKQVRVDGTRIGKQPGQEIRDIGRQPGQEIGKWLVGKRPIGKDPVGEASD